MNHRRGFHNHKEGPYYDLLLIESAYKRVKADTTIADQRSFLCPGLGWCGVAAPIVPWSHDPLLSRSRP